MHTDTTTNTDASGRGKWTSGLGFILAASGSAIGLGNIVFFSSNAYQYGGGAFYLPYFAALFLLGLPVMILEFGLGIHTGRALPAALSRMAGRRGEFVGWWSQGCALIITMYYITILGWALGMLGGSLGSLFEAGVQAPFAPFETPTTEPSPTVFFFHLISTSWPLITVLVIWGLNILILIRGTHTIERAVRLIVPLMWLFMLGLVVRGLTLDGGIDGMLYLFTPDLAGIAEPSVWKGAFAQMFFSLSLGLGTMTAYASYLDKKADPVNNALAVSFLNCSFEYVAGLAIFAMLFAFSLNPAGSTLTLSFFAIPQGIASFSWGVRFFGFVFFLLIVMAGLTSSISLIEGPVSALRDAFGINRNRALLYVAIPGMIGSLCFALPQVIDPALAGNGTLGLSLLDAMDHWAFNYSLLTVGLLECVLVGWVFGAAKLRAIVNERSRFTLGAWFDVLIKYIVPGLITAVLVWSLVDEWQAGQIYGSGVDLGGFNWIPYAMPLLWLFGSLGFAGLMTMASRPVVPSAATVQE